MSGGLQDLTFSLYFPLALTVSKFAARFFGVWCVLRRRKRLLISAIALKPQCVSVSLRLPVDTPVDVPVEKELLPEALAR